MRSILSRSLVGLACAAACGLALAHGDHGHDHDHDDDKHEAQHAHVHGVAHLDAAVDGKTLQVQLEVSASDIVGFEYAPRTAEEKQKVAAAKQALLKEAPLSANAEAACTLKKAEVDFDDMDDDHDHDHAKDDKHRHAKDDKHASVHSDVEAEYTFHCDKPQALQSLEVNLAKRFASVHTIEVQLALPQGQFRRTLSAGQTQVSWK
ncbi:DUF2796 domain-containing protein [Comamonadaceae bacterium OH3737_COT-264]|nr:DUF2796 domain-containing protein [Comamonadaceae bacterium OH3737_COT-264]